MAFNHGILFNVYSDGIYQAGAGVAFAGGKESGNSGDGGPAINARFNALGPLAVDPMGNVYVVDPDEFEISKFLPKE